MSNITQTFKSKQDQSRHFLFFKIPYNNQKDIQDTKVHEKNEPICSQCYNSKPHENIRK